MQKPMLIIAILLLSSTATAEPASLIYPIIPSEEQKKNALLLAYRLNGNSMSRDITKGSWDFTGVNLEGIDVNTLDISEYLPAPPQAVRTIPIAPDRKKR